VHGAVLTAHADRIGHGVALRSEPGWEALLGTMASRHVGVAVLLTSNAQILGVEGAAHPFDVYRAAGVPVMLATDDQGISRGSHTGEFVRAIRGYGLTWLDVKLLVRTSLEQSFARGPSLWRSWGPEPVAVAACAGDRPGARAPSRTCQAFLAGSDRAREQWRLEEQLAEFEARAW
jgi:adenosine deaminase